MMRGDLADGVVIRRIRAAADLTQKELAMLAGCDEKTVRKAERSGRLDVASLQKIAHALSVDYRKITPQHAQSQLRQRSLLHIVQQWRTAFNQRNLRQMLAPFLNDCVLRVPGAPEIPFAGTFRGKRELRRHAELCLSTLQMMVIHVTGCRLDASGDFVFLRGLLTMQRQARSRRCRCYAVHEFRFEQDQIAEATLTYDTLATYKLLREANQ